ncbi:hypothetical protein GY45DRAFT_210697 [Cubamyces sp. BRFM 1775]|nr:hypothetical protein GY45DRAFT_210697 [Cubamyces sp. BRFM 1775]
MQPALSLCLSSLASHYSNSHRRLGVELVPHTHTITNHDMHADPVCLLCAVDAIRSSFYHRKPSAHQHMPARLANNWAYRYRNPDCSEGRTRVREMAGRRVARTRISESCHLCAHRA